MRWMANREPMGSQWFRYRYLLWQGERWGAAISVEFLWLTGVVNEMPWKRGGAGRDAVVKKYGCHDRGVSPRSLDIVGRNGKESPVPHL